ncbi:hypothetical protein BB987_09365 [Photorhabdus temperata]|uniref:Uncharacterized protein n=1 Tax=Photorhabdus khanii NC19 TaxID=1004151 RepID=W3V7M9_9GAMM|nr:hypothetical protein [Photorhabdus khanii]ETS31110.1 hypothetical protein PTE_03062 [Photorhabdus khanii NC19]OHV54915.1 hypothetical protein BB987_09365 [Photorhabdus temperata]
MTESQINIILSRKAIPTDIFPNEELEHYFARKYRAKVKEFIELANETHKLAQESRRLKKRLAKVNRRNKYLKKVLFAGAFVTKGIVHKYALNVGTETHANEFIDEAEKLTGKKLPKFI